MNGGKNIVLILFLLILSAIAHAQEPCSPLFSKHWGKYIFEDADSNRYTFDNVLCQGEFIYVRDRSGWGILTDSGQWRIKPVYSNIQPYNEGLAQVSKSGKTGLIDESGKERLPLKYLYLRPLGTAGFLGKMEKGWDLIDNNGRILNQYPYEHISSFYDGLALVKANNRYGLITDKCTIITEPKYDRIDQFFENYAMVSRNGKWGHIDREGNEVIPLIYDEVFVFYQGLAIARIGDKWGYIDEQNRTIIPFEYSYVEYFQKGRALVSKEGKWGYIDRSGSQLIPIIYDRIHPFNAGWAKVELNGKQGYIRPDGNIAIKPEYDEIYRFAEGRAVVRNDKKYGLISEQGALLLDPVFDYVYPFRDGLARIKQAGHYGLIDRSGKILAPPVFDEIGEYRGGLLEVRRGYQWSLLSLDGTEITEEEYPTYAAQIKVDDNWGYLDYSGQAFGFEEQPVEFFDQQVQLGILKEGEQASYTFNFLNNSDEGVRINYVYEPCGCTLDYDNKREIRPGEYGQVKVNCNVWEDRFKIQMPISLSNGQVIGPLSISGEKSTRRQNRENLKKESGGKYVFLLDISASMDELPLAKMIFSKLAGSLCMNDNISIVSFNSHSRVELSPSQNHSEVVHLLRSLKPALNTDAAKGLRTSFDILSEPGNAVQKHIYMASDGDIDSSELSAIMQKNNYLDATLTIFVFSYTGDHTAFNDVVRTCSMEGVRFVYVDRENISDVLNTEYTHIGCLPSEPAVEDSSMYVRTTTSSNGLAVISEDGLKGLVDAYDNLIMPPVYNEVRFEAEGPVCLKLNGWWGLSDGCTPITHFEYDSIGHFENGRAMALKKGEKVWLDMLGREYDYLEELVENPMYENRDILEGQPFNHLTLLLDVSSSMNTDNKLKLLQTTFGYFSGILRYEDLVSIVTYTSEAQLELPSTSGSERRKILEVLDGLESRGATKVVQGLEMAYREAMANYIPNGNNRVILATDGRFEITESLEQVLISYRLRGIHLSIYLFGGKEPTETANQLKTLAQKAGGSYRYITNSNIRDALLSEAMSRQVSNSRQAQGATEKSSE